MTDVLYFGSDSCMPLSENYVKSNSYIQKLLFVDKKKYEEKTKNSDDTAGWQTLIHLVKTDRENILAKDKFYSVSCGSKYTILVNTEGILWGFGHSSRKHLFQGSFSSGNVPTKLTLSAEQRYMSIACGDNHFVAITTNQMPYAWGDAGQGRLIVNGEPSTVHARQIHLENFTKVIESDSKSHFKKVYYAPEASQLPVDDRFTSLDSFACGPDNTFFVINSKVFAAGKGNLGVGATNIISNEYLQETGPTPFILYNLFRYKIKGVSAGKAHALAWDVEGFLYSWGDPEYGKLGHPVDSETLFEKEILPKKVKSLEDERIVQAACGYRHSVALTNTGHIYMWGNCESVEKGTPMRENTLSFANIRPKKLEVAGSKPEDSHVVFVKVTAGAYHNAAIDKNGRLYTWGDSSSGCLGHEKTNDRAVPTLITAIKHKKVIDVSCGEKFTVAIVSSKDAKIVSKCLEEFTQNSIKTFQERLKAINEFNYKKKKFRIDKKKKELSYAPPEEIKIPITKMSQKNITDELTKYYIQKSTETNPKNRDKLDFKVPFLSASKVIEDLMDIHNTSASDKHKESSSSFIKPPSMTKIDPVSSRDEEDQPSNSQRRKPKRGLTISPEFRFAGNKNSDDYYGPGSASKTSYSPQKQFFTTPKRPEPKRSITSIQNPPNISYVFDAVTEHLNEKSDYYNEFKSALKNKQSDEPGQTNSHRQFDMKAGQTVKQAETEMNRKGHVRRSDFDFISNSKVITKSRPQTAKSVQPGRFDFRPSTAKSIQQSRIEFTSPKMASVATSNFYGSQLARPFSSCTTNSSPLRVKVKRSEGFKEYDHLKALELEKRNEDFENRSKVIAERKTLQIQEIAAERDFKIRMVQEKKAYLQQEKKQKIADMTYKRSPEFKNILEHVKGRKVEIEHLQKYFIGLIGCQHLAYTMMLVIKQAHNKLYMTRIRNTMAGKIQKAWKKHKIIQRVNLLTDKQKNIIRIMLMKYVLKRKRILKAKRLRKVYLMFQYQNMSKKIAQKLLALRNMIIPIQKFVQWSRRIFRLRFRKLALAWDVNMMRLTNIKVEENKLLSAAVGKLNSIEHNSPAKVTTKVELNMNKQKRAIDMEITSLGLNKKDAGKKAGDIKTRMEVIMDHMKLRGALLSLGDDDHQKQQQHQQQLQVHQPHQAGSHGPRKSVIDGRSSHGKLELIVSYESIVRETILAYSVHDNEITFAAQYLVKKDSGSTHEKILPRLVQFEIQLKMKILREIYEDRLMSYEKSIKDYEWQLKDFMIKNRKDIDLERTRLMLSTPKETLRAISRKEETEFRMENVNTNSNKRRPLNQLGLGEKDHLPFAKLKIKIAAAMHDAPKFPSYKTGITFEEFKVYFKRFYEEYRTGYAQIIQAARLKGRVAYKG